MTREQAKELLPIIQAYAEGKTIEFKTDEGGWSSYGDMRLGLGFSRRPEDYRIKPEPKYRPFENSEECWTEMQKHQPFGWISTGDNRKVDGIEDRYYCLVTEINERTIENIDINGNGWTYEDMIGEWFFADGQPFGIKVEEDAK